jgi:autotransporter-associated beta strand protein
MKNKYIQTALRGTLAVPAAALMLGAAQAGTTVGLNFQSWYYDSGASPQTIGFGKGYQTTGFPVTAKAFGVATSDWVNTNPYYCGPQNIVGVSVGALTMGFNSANLWQSGYNAPGQNGPTPGVSWVTDFPANWSDGAVVQSLMTPGNYEVTWSFLDNTGWDMTLSGLNAQFPSGYAVALIGGNKTTATSSVGITENAGSTSVGTVTFTILRDNMGVGSSPVLTADSITFTNPSRPDPANVALAGFIVTDTPVVTSCQADSSTVATGASFTLTGTAIGIGTLSYQWKHDGNDVGTNSPTYTVAASSLADGGDYTLTVTSSAFPGESAISETVSVTVLEPAVVTWDADTGTTDAQDGSGTWDNTTASWWDGSSNVTWSPLNPATFGNGGSGPYTVTLAESITSAGGITFNGGNYTIAPTAAETLTLNGSSVITTNSDATISVNLTGSTGYTKEGASTLTLTTTGHPITGPVVVNEGTLNLPTNGAGTSLTINSGATVNATSTGSIGYLTNCYILNVNDGTYHVAVGGNAVWAMNTTLSNGSLTSVAGGNWSFGGGSQITSSGTSDITGGTFILRESNPDDTLPFNNSGDLTLDCPISGNNRKILLSGSGTTTLAGNSSNISLTTLTEGTLAVTGRLTGGTLQMDDLTTLNVAASGSTSAIALTGDLSVATDYLNPSTTPNVMNFSKISSTTVAPISAAGNLFLDNPITINIESVVPFVGQYPLMTTTPGNFTLNSLTLGTLPSGITATLFEDLDGTGAIYLNVTEVTVPSIVWTGNVAGGVWDIDTTANWSPTNYMEGDVITFDDTATGTTDVVLNTIVNPSIVTFDNTALDYSLSGSGAIAGATSLIKKGAATTTITTTNTFSGGTSIEAGTLVIKDTVSGSILNDAMLEINASAGPLTYSSSISGTGTLTKTGADMLTINGGLALTTPVTAAEGTLEMQARVGDAPYIVESGATLKIGYSTGGGYANTNLKLYGDGAAATTGLYLKGGTTYNVSGTLDLLDAPTTIRQYGTGVANLGIFDINSTGLRCNAAASGSATDANINFVNYGFGMTINVAAGTETATGDFTLNGALDVNHSGNGFYKRGSGSLRLNSPATANNRWVRITGGSIICGAEDCLGTNSQLAFNPGTFLDLNGFNQTVQGLRIGNFQMVAGTWGATGSGATHINDTYFSGAGVLTVVTGADDFAVWAAANAPGQTIDQDSDADGVSNGIEYFMGDNGSGFTANPGVVAGSVSWPRSATYGGAYGTHYKVQTSPDLETWTDVLAGDPNLSDGASLRYTLPTGEAKVFTRLVVTGP